MKLHTLFMLATTLVLLPLLAPGLQAQEQVLFQVNVPFEFVAGGVHLAAGEYLGFHATPTLIQFVRKDGRASAWVPVKPSPVASGGTTNQIVSAAVVNDHIGPAVVPPLFLAMTCQ